MIDEPYSVMTATKILRDIQEEEYQSRVASLPIEERAALVYEFLEMKPLTKEDYMAITGISNATP